MDLTNFVQSYIDNTYLEKKEFMWERLPADGSKRIFYRLSNNQDSFIIMINPPLESNAEKENVSYLKIGQHLLSKGIPVAHIYRYDIAHGWFIMEDLGINNLQEIALRVYDRTSIYKRVIELLVRIQIEGRKDFNPEWCCHTKQYDRFVMEKYESDYFLTYFLKGSLGLTRDLSGLKAPFNYLAERASFADNNFFLYRDFQSRNLIINRKKIGLVDWQGARLGPLQYDLASLLIDPYVGLEKHERRFLYDYYLELLEKRLPGISDSFRKYYPYLAIQRNLQILGAFSYLSTIQGKQWFLAYILPASKSLERLLQELDDPALYPLIRLINVINKFYV
jgi:aminoglycoside/choline kinase family phosphotransferase